MRTDRNDDTLAHTDATVGCLYVLIHLSRGDAAMGGEHLTRPVRNREAPVTEPYVA
jgi:hypothetical protein